MIVNNGARARVPRHCQLELHDRPYFTLWLCLHCCSYDNNVHLLNFKKIKYTLPVLKHRQNPSVHVYFLWKFKYQAVSECSMSAPELSLHFFISLILLLFLLDFNSKIVIFWFSKKYVRPQNAVREVIIMIYFHVFLSDRL